MKFLSCLLLVFASVTAKATCFPQTLKIVPESETHSGISQKTFNRQLDLIIKYFQPEAQSFGFEIEFNRAWSDSTINSDTYVSGSKWIIDSYGGLARYKGMTADGYLAVACHELGHHLGGFPFYSGFGNEWASVEGGSDYFATLRCLKEIGLSPKRIAKASQVLANVLADLGGEPVPNASTPDQHVVSQTEEDHPAAQCRLDTYLNGAACPDQGQLDAKDPRIHSCYDYDSKVGVRPLCWFKP